MIACLPVYLALGYRMLTIIQERAKPTNMRVYVEHVCVQADAAFTFV